MFAAAENYEGMRRVVDDTAAILLDWSTWDEAGKTWPYSERPRLVPNVVCILDQCLLILDSEHEGRIRIRGFETSRASAALALAQLFAFVRATLSGESGPGELDAVLEHVDGLDFRSEEVALPQS
ncbi:hypothetical protein ACI2UW_24280 [Ralstonia nicotianae]